MGMAHGMHRRDERDEKWIQQIFSNSLKKTINLPVVLYWCETWSLTLREEHRLQVVENRVLRRIFGPKRDDVTGEWRKLHNEELHILYSSLNVIRQIKSRRMRSAGRAARMGGDHLKDQGIDGRMRSEWILGRLAGGCRVDLFGSG
jgi:hypothetical protein